MDDLRLILLLIGVGVIAGIYVWTRFQSRPFKLSWKSKSSDAARQSHAEEPDDAAIQQELERMQQVMSGRKVESAATNQELLVVVSVVAPPEQPFHGEVLRKAFANNELHYGDKSIFHRVARKDGEDIPVFGVANMVKPGIFSSSDLEGFSTPGITLFLQLPAAVDGLQAFDDFVHTVERLAVELGGQLRDEKHCVITHQALMQIRENIASSRLLKRVAS
jgi:cell division protein ZipA